MVKKQDIIMGRAAAYYGAQALCARHEAVERRCAEKEGVQQTSGLARAIAACRRWWGDGHAKLWRSV